VAFWILAGIPLQHGAAHVVHGHHVVGGRQESLEKPADFRFKK
jgi:hypothetical protein